MTKSSDDPRSTTPTAACRGFCEIMRRLRDPETGCPWDIEQDFATIAPYTIEEAYEVADAIERRAWGETGGRTGRSAAADRLSHPDGRRGRALHLRRRSSDAISDKMVARHPHVFGDESRDKIRRTADPRLGSDQGRRTRDQGRGRCAGRRGASACLRCMRAVQAAKARRARRLRLALDRSGARQDRRGGRTNWPRRATACAHEEMTEEFGDLLFVIANLARHLGDRPRRGPAQRQRQIHPPISAGSRPSWRPAGKRPDQSDLAEMDALWDAVKADERNLSD